MLVLAIIFIVLLILVIAIFGYLNVKDLIKELRNHANHDIILLSVAGVLLTILMVLLLISAIF